MIVINFFYFHVRETEQRRIKALYVQAIDPNIIQFFMPKDVRRILDSCSSEVMTHSSTT